MIHSNTQRRPQLAPGGGGPGTLPTVGNICTAAGGHEDVPGTRPWRRTGTEPVWFPPAQLLPLRGPAQLSLLPCLFYTGSGVLAALGQVSWRV